MYTLNGAYSTARILGCIDAATTEQIIAMINSPAFDGDVVIMEDAHAGAGSVIGTTMPINDKVCPATVGVDIGCGVSVYEIESIPSLDLEHINSQIRLAVPTEFDVRLYPLFSFEELDQATFEERKRYASWLGVHAGGYQDLCKRVGAKESRALLSIGTLGGGNHFIEVGTLKDGSHAFTIHTGSRGLGFRTATYHQNIAASHMRSLHLDSKQEDTNALRLLFDKGLITGPELGKRIKELKTPPKIKKDLEYLEGPLLNQYLYDMYLCQIYADTNRDAIAKSISATLGIHHNQIVQSVHNFIDPVDNILRKGAIEAYQGDTVAIPMNRIEGTWICSVLEPTDDRNFSLPHGAGRAMSRTEAKQTVSQVDADTEMIKANIFSSNNPRDESAASYKDPETIWRSIGDYVDVIDKVTPILNIK